MALVIDLARIKIIPNVPRHKNNRYIKSYYKLLLPGIWLGHPFLFPLMDISSLHPLLLFRLLSLPSISSFSSFATGYPPPFFPLLLLLLRLRPLLLR
jgi:hypothetical protein